MFRRAGIATLVAALAIATGPAQACTGISLKAKDGAAVRGRTLEFGYPIHSNVIVVPAGKEMSGTLPDGGKGLSYTTRYSMVGANALGLPLVVDGVNDQGLSVGLFYFPGYAKYAEITKENASHAIAPQEFGIWALGNFASVDEVREAVKQLVLAPTPAPGLGTEQGLVPPVHFFIQDKTGKSLVVEPIDGSLKVYDAPLGVMTNAPGYDWHMANLRNYINLSTQDVDGVKLGPVELEAFGAGAGLHGLPGDFTPPSRFVRAALFSQMSVPTGTAEDTVLSAFHILNQFDIPVGSVRNSALGNTMDEATQWTSVADLKNLRWYYRSYSDQSIHVVDLRQAVDAAKGETRQIKMDSDQPVANVSTNFVSGKEASEQPAAGARPE